jgi:hypothetical protein
MFEDINYGGLYEDNNISVSITLIDPIQYDLEANRLTFQINISSINDDDLHEEDFTFYLMTDNNRIQNTAFILQKLDKSKDDTEPNYIQGYIHTDFNFDYIFQSLRIALFFQPFGYIMLIPLRHFNHNYTTYFK